MLLYDSPLKNRTQFLFMKYGNGYERHIDSYPHSLCAMLALGEDGEGTDIRMLDVIAIYL